jgi:hypothetical protein
MIVATTTPLLAALEKSAHRVSLLLRSASKPEAKAIGNWSVAETANHLAHCYTSLLDAFHGTFSVGIDEVDDHNDRVLADDAERDLDVLADRVEIGVRNYLEVAGTFDEETLLSFFSDVRVPAAAVTATVLGEALVHGYDIARAEGLPWAIEPAHALLLMDALSPVMKLFVDEDAAAGFQAGFEIRLHGASSTYWYFDRGRLTIEQSRTHPVDCHISADPVTFMLMSYNRIGPIKPLLTGRLIVWGRRPWMAARLGGVFKT